MDEKTKINLKEELLELEDMMNALRDKAKKIEGAYGINFVELNPKWANTGRWKMLIHLHNGIFEVAEALGTSVTIKKEFASEKANFTNRECMYIQLPVCRELRYKKANEK